MRHPNDNIDKCYQKLAARPDSITFNLKKFNEVTEKTYAAFKDIVQDHADIGKAAILIMAMNQASHIMKIADDPQRTHEQKKFDIHAIIAPMFLMMYDRYTKEQLEKMVSILDGEDEEAEEK